MPFAIQYDFVFKGALVQPGRSIRIRCSRSPVVYECIMHNMTTNKTYIIVIQGKERRWVPIDQITGLVNLKRSRNNVERTREDRPVRSGT